MRFEQINKLSSEKLYRLVDIKHTIFDKMLTVLKETELKRRKLDVFLIRSH